MAVKSDQKHASVYRAAAKWVDACLRQGSSLFTPEREIWRPKVIEDLRRRFVLQPDESDRDFITKFRGQLAGTSDPTIQLAAEILFLHLLAPCVIGAAAKRSLVSKVLSWLRHPLAVPRELDEAFESCLLTDMSFNLQRPFFLAYLVEFAGMWWDASAEVRDRALEDPQAFKAFAMSVPISKAFGQREVLLHLVHPDYFEPISSRKHKERIARVFGSRSGVNPSDDVDARLLAIRSALVHEFGKGFSYYSPALKPHWQKDVPAGETQWAEFIRWIVKVLQWPGFDEGERNYKIDAAEVVRAAQLRIDSDDWLVALRKAFQSPKNNLTSWMTHDRFLKWCESDRESAREALKTLWQGGSGPAERLGAFIHRVPADVLPRVSEQVQIGSFLLIGEKPSENPVVRATPFKRAFMLAGQPHPQKGGDAQAYYEYVLEFLDRVRSAASNAGAAVRDRLDVQSAVWVLTKWEQPPDDWSAADKEGFRAFRERESGGVDGPDDPPVDPPAQDVDELAAEVFLDTEDIEEMLELLREKGQAIFYGPPGTGKTFVAQRIAAHIAGRPDRVTLVQFHSAYSYEDFVEGYRPTAGGGFSLQPGPLRRIAEQAAANPSEAFVVVIDEINRANVAKVFGELYFLLEYRDESVTPTYRPGETLSLPKNLFVIGTMNTADRSIALLDSALRRRFYFFPFFPDQRPVEGLLRRWFERPGGQPEFVWVADVLDETNRRLRELSSGRHLAVGPSHFMKPNLTTLDVQRIWKHSVIPQLEEVFFGDEERLTQFSLDTVRRSTRAAHGTDGNTDDDSADGE